MNFATLSKFEFMADEEDPELKRLRMQRLQKILAQKKQAEAQKNRKTLTMEDKIEMLLNILLTPDAKQYLNGIKQKDKNLYLQIRNKLFPPQVTQHIDTLMAYYARGMIRKGVISRTEVRYLERKVRGVGSSITIKKQGEDAMSLGDYLKEEE